MSNIINWTKILGRVTPRLQARVNLIRMQNDDLKRQISELEGNKPEIKWDYFKANIEDSSFVSNVENEVKSFKPLQYTFSKVEGSVSEDEKALKAKYDDFFKTISKELEDLNDRIEAFDSAPPAEIITKDEIYELYPGLKDTVVKNIEADMFTLDLVEKDEIETVWEPLEEEFWSGKTLFSGGGHQVEEFIEERFQILAQKRKEIKLKGDLGGRFSDAIAEILEKYDINKVKPETA